MSMEEQLKHSPLFWAALAILLIAQSLWLFLDARKRGSYYWFWGLWGLTSLPMPLLLYLLIVRIRIFRKGR